jgi:outer membrane protease
MKTKQSQKTIRQAAFATLSAFTILSAFAPMRASALDVSVSPYIEANSGDAREYVYADDKLLSELIWDMKPMVSIGAAIDVGWTGGLLVSAEASAAIPGTTGSMRDSDWLNLLSDGTEYKTTYSKHDADLEFAYWGKIDLGWDILLPVTGPGSTDRVSLVPSIGFKFMNWKWNGTDGYLQHTGTTGTTDNGEWIFAPWTKGTAKTDAKGTVISYQQQYWMPTGALAVSVPLGSRFRIDAGCSGTPMVWCYALDEHFIPKSTGDYSDPAGENQYFDMMSSGWMIEPELRLAWDCAKGVKLYASGSWTKIGGLRGDTRYLANGASEYETFAARSGAGGGAALETVNVRLGAEFQLNGLIRHKP